MSCNSQERHSGDVVDTSAAKERTGSPATTILRYSTAQKWCIVLLTSAAGVFSPLTANVYFPAIPAMAEAFHSSVQTLNLSVTAYVIVQGIAPLFWGPLADAYGRRPCMIGCLALLCVSSIAIALVPAPGGFWLLILMRCIQACSASTYPIGAGLLADITEPHERGGMLGLFTIGQAAPAIGPVLAGVIAEAFGWRGILWALALASAIALLFVLLFLPETLPAVVGDGQEAQHVNLIYRPFIPVFTLKVVPPPPEDAGNHLSSPSRQPTTSSTSRPRNPFRLMLSIPITLLLAFNGVLMAAFYAISATLTPLYQVTYPFLTTAQLGYCFLAFGGTMAIGTRVVGWVLDVEFRKETAKIGEEGFRLARARLVWSLPILVLFAVCCAPYGWGIAEGVHLAFSLAMLAVYGFAFIWLLIASQTLLVDLAPDQGSSVTALNNLARCITGAVFVSVIQLAVDSLGPGWMFVVVSGILAMGGVMIWLVRSGRLEERDGASH